MSQDLAHLVQPAATEFDDKNSRIERTCKMIAARDFCFLPSAQTRELLESLDPEPIDDWEFFRQSWDDLRADEYMADGGTYRLRRHATLSCLPSSRAFQLQPHRPHYQSLTYNGLNGGRERHYEPIEHQVMQGTTMQSLLRLGCELFGRLDPYSPWHIEAHQFRITGHAGKPTPEGIHRDGVNYVLMMMVQRVNLVSDSTTIYDRHKCRLDEFTLQQPFDMAIVNDERTMHGVSPIVQLDTTKACARDVLVLTYRRQG